MLSKRDEKIVRSVVKNGVPEWRTPMAWLFIIGGLLTLLGWLFEILVGAGDAMTLGAGIAQFCVGLVQLQEVRYRRIISHFLKENASTDAPPAAAS